MKRAATLATQTNVTEAQAFEAIYTSPGEVLKRRSRAALPVPPNNSKTDDDEVDSGAESPPDGMGDADAGPQLGHRGEPHASTCPEGSSTGDYEHSGINRMTNSRSMAGQVRNEGSYDDKARPASATRRPSLKRMLKEAKRVAKLKRLMAAG
jgi:hypothetical protein